MIIALFDIVLYLLKIMTIVILVQVVLSWLVAFNVVNLQQPFVRGLYTALDRLTEPLYRPIRKIMPDFGGLDFSPLVLFILIQLVAMFVGGARNDVLQSMI